MAKRFLLVTMLMSTLALCVVAGDIATFVNLGFSHDSDTFMFSQYGIDAETSKPFANLYVVNVPKNDFVPSGVIEKDFEVEIFPGQDGSGAFYTILEENVDLVKTYDIGHLNQGRLVYLLVNGAEPKSHIEFRDFNTGNRYEINLVQMTVGEGKSARAAFHIQLSVFRPNGEVDAHTVGLPGYYRDGVSTYRIKQVVLAPDEQSIVFVVAKEMVRDRGKTIRYMVETVATR
jgi:predicted secreted protein